jgi:hypothetical protein
MRGATVATTASAVPVVAIVAAVASIAAVVAATGGDGLPDDRGRLARSGRQVRLARPGWLARPSRLARFVMGYRSLTAELDTGAGYLVSRTRVLSGSHCREQRRMIDD